MWTTGVLLVLTHCHMFQRCSENSGTTEETWSNQGMSSRLTYLPSDNQTWLAVKSLVNGHFDGTIIYICQLWLHVTMSIIIIHLHHGSDQLPTIRIHFLTGGMAIDIESHVVQITFRIPGIIRVCCYHLFLYLLAGDTSVSEAKYLGSQLSGGDILPRHHHSFSTSDLQR